VPNATGTFQIKGESIEDIDWFYFDPNWVDAYDSAEAIDRLEEMVKDPNASYPMESAWSRDGLYDKDQLFLVFERSDVINLMNIMERGVSGR
jgi:hypothetical protein